MEFRANEVHGFIRYLNWNVILGTQLCKFYGVTMTRQFPCLKVTWLNLVACHWLSGRGFVCGPIANMSVSAVVVPGSKHSLVKNKSCVTNFACVFVWNTSSCSLYFADNQLSTHWSGQNVADGEGLPAGEGRGGQGGPEVCGGPWRLVQLWIPLPEDSRDL